MPLNLNPNCSLGLRKFGGIDFVIWQKSIIFVPCERIAFMADEKSHSEKRDLFVAFLKTKGLRCTFERRVVLDKVLQMKKHFTVDSLSGLLEEGEHHISVATIYSSLKLLEQCGIVRMLNLNGSCRHYEQVSVSAGHVHLICTRCGKVKAVRDDDLMMTVNSKSYPAFTGEQFALYYYGICNACARKHKKTLPSKS